MKKQFLNKPDKNFKIEFNPDSIVVTVNVLIFTIRNDKLEVLLMKRAYQPFMDFWALPGGVFDPKESLDDAACRILKERTGVDQVNTYLEQLYTFGDPKRDPRERRIGVTYYALVPSDHLKLQAEGKAKDAKWWALKQLPELAFDHRKIVNLGYDRLKTKVGYSSIVLELMPSRFRLSELQKAYEVILGEEIDKRNFRKQMKELDLVEATGLKEMDGAHRPAMLFKAKKKRLVLFK